MNIKRHALRSWPMIGLVLVTTVLGVYALIGSLQDGQDQASTATTLSSAQVTERQAAEAAATAKRRRELEELGFGASATTTTTMPATTTTTTEAVVATTTTVPATTTTVPPTTTTVWVPNPPVPAQIPTEQLIAGLIVPEVLKVDYLGVYHADAADDGYQALLGGPALFTSSGRDCTVGPTPDGTDCLPAAEGQADFTYPYDLGAPGSGRVVAIGAHATTANQSIKAPFENLHLMQEGMTATVHTVDSPGLPAWGVYTYQVVPCGVNGEIVCSLDVEQLMAHFASYQSSVETLFLFTCDEDLRVFVKLELIGAGPTPPAT